MTASSDSSNKKLFYFAEVLSKLEIALFTALVVLFFLVLDLNLLFCSVYCCRGTQEDEACYIGMDLIVLSRINKDKNLDSFSDFGLYPVFDCVACLVTTKCCF